MLRLVLPGLINEQMETTVLQKVEAKNWYLVGDPSGFVKVGDGDAQMRARAAELQRREEELAQREADLLQREAALAAQRGVGGAMPQWHAALLAGLAEVKSHALQSQLAAESCGVVLS